MAAVGRLTAIKGTTAAASSVAPAMMYGVMTNSGEAVSAITTCLENRRRRSRYGCRSAGERRFCSQHFTRFRVDNILIDCHY